jgi:hypothetical protein
MSRENLDFMNFKLLFLKTIFYGLSLSAKMAKVELVYEGRLHIQINHGLILQRREGGGKCGNIVTLDTRQNGKYFTIFNFIPSF